MALCWDSPPPRNAWSKSVRMPSNRWIGARTRTLTRPLYRPCRVLPSARPPVRRHFRLAVLHEVRPYKGAVKVPGTMCLQSLQIGFRCYTHLSPVHWVQRGTCPYDFGQTSSTHYRWTVSVPCSFIAECFQTLCHRKRILADLRLTCMVTTLCPLIICK